jgi:signal transduction histidine kinase/signal transduction protein with GAF and PtsI domain
MSSAREGQVKRRRATSRKPAKAQQAIKAKRGPAPKAARNRVSASSKVAEIARLTHERDEALKREKATAEVLRVIANSAGELAPVFNSMLANAVRLCAASFGNLYLRDGEFFRLVAFHNTPAAFVARRRAQSYRPGPNAPPNRMLSTRAPVHVADLTADPSYVERDPGVVAFVELAGTRTVLLVPMLKDDEPIGYLSIYRREVHPFEHTQVELLVSFAAQAVIAIENARLLNELRQRTSDLAEALEQQRASAEVLNVISNSVSETKPVFEKIVESCERIFATSRVGLNLIGPDGLVHAGAYGKFPGAEKLRKENFPHPLPGSATGAVINAGRPLQYPDALSSDVPHYGRRAAKIVGFRAFLMAPLLSEERGLGAIFVGRETVGSFSDKEIALVQSFAAQAVIAIKNTRLLNELRESLQQQTATADVLKVISRSTFDLKSVLNTLVESAAGLCEADMAALARPKGSIYEYEATFGHSREHERFMSEHPARIDRGTAVGRTLVEGKTVHIADVLADPEYTYLEGQRLGGFRTLLGVPLLREGIPIGVMVVLRKAVRPFTDRQIELVTTFADQAVIAIENTRVLNELRESLQQQTATADVLKVISRSTFDLKAVLNTLTESAAQLCGAEMAAIARRGKGNAYYYATTYNWPAEASEFLKSVPHEPGRGSTIGRCLLEGKTVQIPDVLADADYSMLETQQKAGYRTTLGVPLLREGSPIGAIGLTRTQVNPFTDKQIELVTTFADQAVIAIENVRLFDEVQKRTAELQESLEYQSATSEVLNVISRSPTNAQPVFDAIVESAARLCEAAFSVVWQFDGDLLHYVASHNFTPKVLDHILGSYPKRPDRSLAAGRAILDGKTAHVPDLLADPSYAHDLAMAGNWRASVAVPMLDHGIPIGAISVGKAEAEPFSDRQMQLLTTFADQAVIAVKNVGLFDEIQEKSRLLAEASQHKSQFLANMSHELRTPLNAILGYTELILDSIYGDVPEKARGVLDRIQRNGRHLLGLINEVLDLSKIEAGQLVLSLADYSLKNVVETVFTAVEQLAKEKKLAFTLDVASDLPRGHGDERRLTQVMLNLAGNAIKFTDEGEVTIRASAANGSFEVAVRDTGPGISAADQARLFQEFQQADNSITRKKGGTGLGLAISKRIIEMHGGRIWIESVVGQGSTFSFTLPVKVSQQAKPA